MTTTRIEKNSAKPFCKAVRANVTKYNQRLTCRTTVTYELDCRDLTHDEARALAAKVNVAGKINTALWVPVATWEEELSYAEADALAEENAERGEW